MKARSKHQRLVLVLLAMAALIGAVLLAMWGLQDRAAYFMTPKDIVAGRAAPGQPIRVGGMVQPGSVDKRPDGVTVVFTVFDGPATVPVRFRGILPDLFKENSGVVAEGSLGHDGVFVADNILAKHDERYMPPQMGDVRAERATEQTLAQ